MTTGDHGNSIHINPSRASAPATTRSAGRRVERARRQGTPLTPGKCGRAKTAEAYMAGVEAGDAKAEPTLRDRIAAAIDGVRLTEADVKEARDYLASRWHEHVKASEERKERAWAAFLETWKDDER